VGHQEPASEALASREASVCRSRLADLNQKRLNVEQESCLHLWAGRHDTSKVISSDAHGFACALDHNSIRRAVGSEHNRDAHHSFAPNQSDFDVRIRRRFGDGGSKPLLDEIDGFDWSIRSNENHAEAARVPGADA
jgi:hypothetical protein